MSIHKPNLLEFSVKRPSVVLICLAVLVGYMMQSLLSMYVISSVNSMEKHVSEVKLEQEYYRKQLDETQKVVRETAHKVDKLENAFYAYLMSKVKN